MAAARCREDAVYQTEYLRNRGVGEAETSEAYSTLVRHDGPLTRCRYAFLVVLFAVNVTMSIAVFFFAVRSQPPSADRPSTRLWKPLSPPFTTTNGSNQWTACRRHGGRATSNKGTAEYCAVIDEDFCNAASEVIDFLSRLFYQPRQPQNSLA